MDINYEYRKPVKKTFKEVAVKDVFMVNQTPHMKIGTYNLISEVSVNCISLANGELILMSDTQEVEVVESTLNILR